MIINKANIIEITKTCSVYAKKDYGQNFLIEETISKKIVDALDITSSDKILEIGPGLGSLTHFLLEESDNVTAVDIDPYMINILNNIYSTTSLKLVNNDIRKVDVSEFDKIIGNLPYNITTELITYLLLNAKTCKKMVLMIQKEAMERIFSLEGKDYSALSIIAYLLGKPTKLFVVKPGSFYPSPKCDSVVFKYDFYSNIDKNNIINAYNFIKHLFLNRRKTIFNNLSNLTKDKSLSSELLKELNIKENLRPENISPEQYINLYNLYLSKK